MIVTHDDSARLARGPAERQAWHAWSCIIVACGGCCLTILGMLTGGSSEDLQPTASQPTASPTRCGCGVGAVRSGAAARCKAWSRRVRRAEGACICLRAVLLPYLDTRLVGYLPTYLVSYAGGTAGRTALRRRYCIHPSGAAGWLAGCASPRLARHARIGSCPLAPVGACAREPRSRTNTHPTYLNLPTYLCGPVAYSPHALLCLPPSSTLTDRCLCVGVCVYLPTCLPRHPHACMHGPLATADSLASIAGRPSLGWLVPAALALLALDRQPFPSVVLAPRGGGAAARQAVGASGSRARGQRTAVCICRRVHD